MLYLTSGAWEDALKKDLEKVKLLEEKYNTKILENGVNHIPNTPKTDGIYIVYQCDLDLRPIRTCMIRD